MDAADWPVGKQSPYQAMSLALCRQAVRLTQHGSMDAFMPIAARYPLHDIATLDELATSLYKV